MTLRELIEALEKAPGGSGDLDSKIAEHIGIEHRPRRTGYGASKGREWLVSHVGGVAEWDRHPPAYTSSLDAAITLVPEGWQWLVRSDEEKGYLANIHRNYECPNKDYECFPIWKPTPALALTLASMMARETMG